MWLLVGPLIVLALVGVVLLPIPLWTARALRARRSALALPPATPMDPTAEANPALRIAAQDAQIVATTLPEAVGLADDVIAVRPWMTLLTGFRQSEENWASNTIDRYYRAASDAQRLFGDWAASLRRLPADAQQLLRGRGFDPESPGLALQEETALAVRGSMVALHGLPSRAEVLQTRQQMTRWFAVVTRFLAAVATHDDPYR